MTEVPQPIKAGVSKVSILVVVSYLGAEYLTVEMIKTKAKARYLKRKKNRRKARKSSAPRKPDDAPQASSASEEDEEHHDEDGIANKVDDNNRNEEVIIMEQPVQPPKKKRRVVGEGPDSVTSDFGEIRDSANKELATIHRPLTKPSGTLPSFPSPTVPNAPPQSVLAMQGIDEALIHAEVISPAAVMPLSTAEQGHNTGLSAKTRRRLLDLGISELFAGQGLITRVPGTGTDGLTCSTDLPSPFPHLPQSVTVYTILYSS